MEILPSGSTGLLVELDDLEQVLALYAALRDSRPDGVIDLVPAARTVLVVIDPEVTTLAAVGEAVRDTEPRSNLNGAAITSVRPDQQRAMLLADDAAALSRSKTRAGAVAENASPQCRSVKREIAAARWAPASAGGADARI